MLHQNKIYHLFVLFLSRVNVSSSSVYLSYSPALSVFSLLVSSPGELNMTWLMTPKRGRDGRDVQRNFKLRVLLFIPVCCVLGFVS